MEIENFKKAVIVGINTGEYDADLSAYELRELCENCEYLVQTVFIQGREKADSKTYVGLGKLEEIKEYSTAYEIDLVVIDGELTASQYRNIEEELDIPVLDRTMVILDIFARRATSSEGAIQVELAQQKYRLPRLAGMGKSLSRLGGGIGTRGPGETKLESDKRHIQRRIKSLQDDLEKIKEHRGRTIARRQKNDVITIAFAGYTNAGKSTLLNKITNSQVLSKDMLFATLDPTARKAVLPEGTPAVFIDTVGFIQRIPHHLIEAFKSTLEHLKYADIIINVLDSSDENAQIQCEVTKTMLNELGCGDIPLITAYNKFDKVENNLRMVSGDKISISATTGQGVEELMDAICEKLGLGLISFDIVIPYSEQGRVYPIKSESIECTEEYTDNGVRLVGKIRKRLYSELF